MARMIPSEVPEYTASKAERELFPGRSRGTQSIRCIMLLDED